MSRREILLRWRLRASLLGVAAIVSVVAAGCGGSTDSSGATTHAGSGGTTSAGGDAIVEEAKARLGKYYAGEFGEPPKSGPKPESGKSIWIVPCGVQAPGCLVEAEAAAEAAKELGWDSRTVDGKLSPAVYNQVIRQATAAQVEGIVLIGINCAEAPSAIKAAVQAGIKVAAEAGDECPDGEGFSTYPVYFNEKTNREVTSTDDSRMRVDWLISELDGKARPLVVWLSDNPISTSYAEGLKAELERCPECEPISAPVTTADLLEGKIQAKIETVLVQHPEANAVLTADDVEWSGGASAAVKASGRELLAVSAEGLDQTIDEIRAGEVNASGVLFLGWCGWSVIDALNRAFAGETGAIPEGNGYMLVDGEHGLPPKSESLSAEGPLSFDWKGAYRKLWKGAR